METSHGVPQGSVLGPLFINICTNDLFMFVTDSVICNYADDTNIYVSNSKHPDIIRKLENENSNMVRFQSNLMKLNGDKCHLMMFSKQNNISSIKIDNNIITESREEKVLGIILDKTLSFKPHLETLCKKVSQKFYCTIPNIEIRGL